ncbi:unnamed protein product [Amaranthus hypochondriacus]
MEVTTSNLATSLACILMVAWVWKTINWLWLKPKRLEKYLTTQGFRGHPYRVLFGDTKEIAQMVHITTCKPIDPFSNDYVPRILPFYCQTINKYGERSFVWNGPIPTVIITKPEDIREILMKMYDFQKTISHPLVKELTNGLTRLEGQKWAQRKKLLNPAFHVHKLKHMVPAFEASCMEMIQEWETKIKETGSRSIELEVWSYLHNLSADAISRTAFGSSFQEGKRVFELLREHISITVQAVQSVYIPGSRFLQTKTNRRATKIIKEMESLLKEMIENRQNEMKIGEEDKDLLGLLIKSSLEGIKNEETLKLSMKEIIEECKMFYLAGQDTTSSLLLWSLVLLSKHQYWQDQARQEIFATFGHNTPNHDGLNQLRKVNMIIYEVLRLYPPLPLLTRKVIHDMKVGDLVLPAGVQVKLLISFVHHSETYWGKDAQQFNPERFSQGILKATEGNMCFFAFGWGPRTCIGSNFAMMEVKMALALILQRFCFQLSPSYVHSPTTNRGTLRPQWDKDAKLILRPI